MNSECERYLKESGQDISRFAKEHGSYAASAHNFIRYLANATQSNNYSRILSLP